MSGHGEHLRRREQVKRAIAARQARVAELGEQRRGYAVAAAEARATLLREQGDALAAGNDLDGRRAADLERTERAAQRKADACGVAANDLAAKAPEDARTLADAEAAFTAAVLTDYRGERDAPAAQVLWTFESMMPDLSALMAAELTRNSLIGTRFTFDTQAFPPATLWSSVHVVGRLLDAVPVQFAPTNFRARVEAEARRLAAKTLAPLEREARNDS